MEGDLIIKATAGPVRAYSSTDNDSGGSKEKGKQETHGRPTRRQLPPKFNSKQKNERKENSKYEKYQFPSNEFITTTDFQIATQ